MLKYFNKFLYTVYTYFYCKDTDLRHRTPRNGKYKYVINNAINNHDGVSLRNIVTQME